MKQIFPDLITNKAETDFFCTVCPLAKQTRLAFNRSSIQTSDVFQLIHVDIWGPMRLQSRNKCTMFITIVDDFSRYTWIFLIQHKSDF